MTHRVTFFRLACLLVLILLLYVGVFGIVPGRANAGELPRETQTAAVDLSAPYALQAGDRSVLDVLRRFADDHGLTLRVAPANGRRATPAWHTAHIAGWVTGESGRDFLEQLASAHHFEWFIANRTLHVSARSDSTAERIALHGMAPDAARTALAAVGLYEARFGWGALTGQDAVLVAGPREYRSLVRRFLAARTVPGARTLQVEPMIFPLRYASAADSTALDGRDGVVPGVASILRQLVAPNDEAQSQRLVLPTVESMQALETAGPVPVASLPIAGPGLVNWLGTAHRATPLPDWRAAPTRLAPASSAPASESEVVIAADARTNTVLVWGDPVLRSRLERLIETLDQPLPMVSMEVLVLEADEATVLSLAAGGTANAPSQDDVSVGGVDTGFHARLSQAISEARATLLNRQALVGFANLHMTLAIGAEESHRRSTSHDGNDSRDENANGRAGNRGDALDLAARLLPARPSAPPALAVDVGLLMAQPTGLPGQQWGSTSSVKLKTAVALESGAAPRLIASYPVASSRSRQRAIFISARAI
ncbi:MAG TPA: secretin N-terminal domain-containing protein [Trinickia sp.]|uniref:secretin N-terminal domain-containing protein n=1 Tax=Trinickia sp. TaxID=2571163 RepID=UPI002B859D00|nr:secretin N-terminal domain-containing protein [Trinickia sp.]HTI19188.1 secretin N-terminal domain-containing protein [Trinickia sp.]